MAQLVRVIGRTITMEESVDETQRIDLEGLNKYEYPTGPVWGKDGFLYLINPALPDGAASWYDPRITWDEETNALVCLTDEEYAMQQEPANWAAIRAERNRLLAGCDWTQLADAPLTTNQTTAWRVYRQALRDLPQSCVLTADVVWPAPPEE